MDRRDFLRLSTAAVVGAALQKPFQSFGRIPLAKQTLRFPPVLNSSTLRAYETQVEVWDNYQTRAFTLNGVYPSPTIVARTGDRIQVQLQNDLPQDHIIHWHGLIVPWTMDGHPMHQIQRGQTYDYDFRIVQRAGTYFYHSHTLHLTAEQTYRGIGGFFIVHDDEEENLGLPHGDFDIPLALQDRRPNSDRQAFSYNPTMRDIMTGYMGDAVLVNGTPNATFNVNRTWYRFRLLNASNARIYLIAFEPAISFHLIATDGGLLEQPIEVSELFLAPGERAEIMVNFTQRPLNSTVRMVTKAFDIGEPPMSDQGRYMEVLELNINGTQQSNGSLPSTLSTIDRYDPQKARRTRTFNLTMFMMQPRINGIQYNLTRIDERIPLNELEIWEFVNNSNMSHPMHVHNVMFQVFQRIRNGQQQPLFPTDHGWKDTVLVRPRETVKVLVKFEPRYTGIYLFHCHNLEHEDADMMLNIELYGKVTGVSSRSPKALEAQYDPLTEQIVIAAPAASTQRPVNIVDIRGRTVFRGTMYPHQTQMRIDVRSFASGLYWIQVGTWQYQVRIWR